MTVDCLSRVWGDEFPRVRYILRMRSSLAANKVERDLDQFGEKLGVNELYEELEVTGYCNVNSKTSEIKHAGIT